MRSARKSAPSTGQDGGSAICVALARAHPQGLVSSTVGTCVTRAYICLSLSTPPGCLPSPPALPSCHREHAPLVSLGGSLAFRFLGVGFLAP
eukprot:COSAG01_NODE_37300_length_505_cov_1.071429_1_plen_91_part_01